MLELYLEHQIVSKTFVELLTSRGELAKMLSQRTGDIEIMAAIRKVENDLDICRSIILKQKPAIIAILEAKHKVKFQFLVDTPKVTPDAEKLAQMKPG